MYYSFEAKVIVWLKVSREFVIMLCVTSAFPLISLYHLTLSLSLYLYTIT